VLEAAFKGTIFLKMVKEVTVFANGDSREIKTWSNVPYFFTETLLSKGIKVNRVDISESPIKRRLFNRTIGQAIRRISPGSTYYYFRSPIHFKDVVRRIKKTLVQYPDSETNIFLTYSFSSAGLTKKPAILVCDWPYEYDLSHFRDRVPDRFERESIRRENQQIESSNVVISLFPRVTGFMKKRYNNDQIFYLGNVVNALSTPDKAEILKAKANSGDVVFIGRPNYSVGANHIVRACDALKKLYPHIRLHIIGMSKEDFPELPGNVICYGYLDKARADQKDAYYALLSRAKVFVNTTPKWGAFSAMLEALYFYVPVITTPYCECVETFGESLSFGEYCTDGSTQMLQEKLRFIFDAPIYSTLCLNAHESVKNFSWPDYIDKVLEKIEATR